ncbi:MAG: ABC transporter permease subunit [Candidatus Latescibacteria bacterium]|nr:ABC transporter permease subunit [bacterium]MBD3425276.1 ABC transporter permease subunit [Candidatus Latescibacterota bacterium]
MVPRRKPRSRFRLPGEVIIMGYLFRFFLINSIRCRRTQWLAFLGLLPVMFAGLILLLKPVLLEHGTDAASLFPEVSVLLYIHFLLPLAAIFNGTAVISSEVEDGTLPYLLTRPLPRRTIVLSKLLAGAAVTAVILTLSIALTYSVMKLGSGIGGLITGAGDYLGMVCILCLGLAAYMPLFSFTGGVLNRPVLAGLIFAFGWEPAISLIPANIRYLSISHYLHLLYSSLFGDSSIGKSAGEAILSIFYRPEEIPAYYAILILILISATFTFLSASLLRVREYRLDKE